VSCADAPKAAIVDAAAIAAAHSFDCTDMGVLSRDPMVTVSGLAGTDGAVYRRPGYP
jgi:hypothetical protein